MAERAQQPEDRVPRGDVRRRLAGLERRYEERTAQVRALAAELGHAEERERRRVGELLHDHVQQILVSIQARGRLLSSRLPEEDPAARRHLAEIDRLATEALHAVRTLTAELSPPPTTDRRLRSLCENLAAQMRQRHDLEVTVEVPSGLRLRQEILLLLRQMLRELLFNVVKHAGVAHARLAARASDDHLEVEVADSGCGIATAEAAAGSMGPAGPEEPAEPAGAPGGYGLPAARRRLALLGGALEITSRPGDGTCCTVRLPRRIVVDDDRQGRRVLLVEDHAALRAALAELIDSQPDLAVCATAACSEEALAAAAETLPELALVDLHLGADDGMRLIERLHVTRPELALLALSAEVDAEASTRCRAAGAADLRSKGDLPGLLAAIRGLLR